VELSEWDMERPVITAQVMKAVISQSKAFAYPHAGCTNQKEDIGQQVIGFA
jgi:hypothetical protein